MELWHLKVKFYKLKVLKKKVKFEELEPLLHKNNKLLINQQKWYKDLSEGNITIKDELYSLMVTGNNRQLIYNKDNCLIETKPFYLTDHNF